MGGAVVAQEELVLSSTSAHAFGALSVFIPVSLGLSPQLSYKVLTFSFTAVITSSLS